MTRRIAIISEHASPLAAIGSVDSGGQNVYVAQVAQNLAAMGYEVDVFTRRDSETQPIVFDWKAGLRVVHVPVGPARFVRKEEMLPFMEDFARFMERFMDAEGRTYDVVHANFFMSGLAALRLKRRRGLPYAVTFHALGHVRRQHQGPADEFPADRLEIEALVAREADRIVAECPQDEWDLVRHYRADSSRITTIPCGFDPAELWPLQRRLARVVLGFSPEDRLILQLGRMVPRKGVETVVRGFKHALRRFSGEAKLLIVGGERKDGKPVITFEIARLQNIARSLGIADKVFFMGQANRDELKYYYSAADAFVTTPWYEPFGITPLEAMACGTPVIGSNVGGVKFSVIDGDTGFLVPPKDDEAVGDRIARLLENPALGEEMGRRGLRRAQTYFTWKIIANNFASMLEQVLLERDASRAPRALWSSEPESWPVRDRRGSMSVRWTGVERRARVS